MVQTETQLTCCVFSHIDIDTSQHTAKECTVKINKLSNKEERF